MDAKSVGAAAIAGVVGAVVWGTIAIYTGYEIGWIAWGIGFLVGAAANMFGGEGNGMGAACIVIVLLSIAGGKLIAIEGAIQDELKIVLEDGLGRGDYEEALEDARQFALVENPSDLRAFIAIRGYASSDDPSAVTDAEVRNFEANSKPILEALQVKQPSYEEWQDVNRRAVSATISRTEVLASSLHPMDLLFALLAVSTAWRLGRGDGEA